MIAQLLSLHPAAGGLAGFHVATDLLQLDFSPPQEAPEEFRAMTFNAPQAAKGKLPTPGEPGLHCHATRLPRASCPQSESQVGCRLGWRTQRFATTLASQYR